MNRRARGVAIACLCLLSGSRACAADAAEEPKLAASIAGFHYAMRDQPDFGIAVAAVNRGAFRLEARYGYEAKNSTSVFAGWKLAGGNDAFTYEATPLIGVLSGAEHAGIVGLEASLAHGPFDVYVEAEYVHNRSASDASYFYAWSEAGWRPVEWLRVGLVGQRTRVVHTDRDVQRGAFAQVIVGPATISVYAFNPDAASRYTIASLALAF